MASRVTVVCPYEQKSDFTLQELAWKKGIGSLADKKIQQLKYVPGCALIATGLFIGVAIVCTLYSSYFSHLSQAKFASASLGFGLAGKLALATAAVSGLIAIRFLILRNRAQNDKLTVGELNNLEQQNQLYLNAKIEETREAQRILQEAQDNLGREIKQFETLKERTLS